MITPEIVTQVAKILALKAETLRQSLDEFESPEYNLTRLKGLIEGKMKGSLAKDEKQVLGVRLCYMAYLKLLRDYQVVAKKIAWILLQSEAKRPEFPGIEAFIMSVCGEDVKVDVKSHTSKPPSPSRNEM